MCDRQHPLSAVIWDRWEIVKLTGISKASTHRLLRELVELSALTFDPDTRKYRGGLLLARIGASVTGHYDLRTIARPFLQALHDEFGHVATLSIRNDDTGIYIDKIEAFTANTIPSAAQLRRELRSVKEQGYGIDNEEITRGLVCVAAPIFGVDGMVAGAMSCTVPSHVNDEQSLAARIESVCRLAEKASTGENIWTTDCLSAQPWRCHRQLSSCRTHAS